MIKSLFAWWPLCWRSTAQWQVESAKRIDAEQRAMERIAQASVDAIAFRTMRHCESTINNMVTRLRELGQSEEQITELIEPAIRNRS